MTKAIQIRLDPKLKKQADRILDNLGLDTPTAIRIFLRRVVVTRSIPFELNNGNLTENGFTPEFEDEVLRTLKEDETIGPFHSAEAMIDSLNGRRVRRKK
jgi:addiction module RelB/DinJ family antitoxin